MKVISTLISLVLTPIAAFLTVAVGVWTILTYTPVSKGAVLETISINSTIALSVIVIYLILKEIWGIETKKLLKLITKLVMRSTMESIADEIEEAASSAISMSEVVEEVQTGEQSIEIEVETPEIVIQRQSKPADKTKANQEKAKATKKTKKKK